MWEAKHEEASRIADGSCSLEAIVWTVEEALLSTSGTLPKHFAAAAELEKPLGQSHRHHGLLRWPELWAYWGGAGREEGSASKRSNQGNLLGNQGTESSTGRGEEREAEKYFSVSFIIVAWETWSYI